MKTTQFSKQLSLIFCIVLITAMALFTGCGQASSSDLVSSQPTLSQSEVAENITILGEGETSFNFSVVDADGGITAFEIYTNKTIVGEVLLDLGLIAGEDGAYGLYVKTVNGITLDYNKDGKYWAFYIGDEYAQTGVDKTNIEAGETYSFKAE